MAPTIVTGPYPGRPGACIAHTYQNSTLMNSNHSQAFAPQQPQNVQSQYGVPSWRPPSMFPYSY